jgi:hypothetical protein
MLRTVAQIVEKSLQLIGAVSPYDESADDTLSRRGIDWFDMIKNNIVGVNKLWFFMDDNQSIPLSDDKDFYNLNALLTPNIQFIYGVRLYKDGEVVATLPLITRSMYEEYLQTNTLPERSVYITNDVEPILRVVPKPTGSGYSIKIFGQKYSKDVSRVNGITSHDFTEAWELYLVYNLASHLGSGVILTLPENSMRRIESRTASLFSLLESRRPNAEQTTKPRIAKLRVI